MENLKNYFINQDITEAKKSLKLKLFDYFYRILSGKVMTGFYILYFFHSIEILQLISYAFSSPHKEVWKMPEKTSNFIDDFFSGFRLAPLLKYLKLKLLTFVILIVFLIILIFFVLLMIQIKMGKENSSCLEKLRNFTSFSIPFFTILLYIPFNELFFSTFDCSNKCLHNRKEEVHCWKGTHLLLVLISIIGIILNLIINSLFTFFYFYPFSTQKISIKLTASVDIVLLLVKIIYVIQNIFIKDEYISIAFLLIFSIFLIHMQDKQPVYNKKKFELFLNLRNIFVFWTFFILLIAKICYTSKIKAMIYLLISGYPLLTFAYIMYFSEKYNKLNYNHTSINNDNDCITQLRLLLTLIDSFLGENRQNINNNNENHNRKNDLMLKGIIKMHTANCLREDCPLTKFINNKGNFNVQKQCLLNYMAKTFITSIKKFPNNILLRMQFIQFNYDKKYNLNSIKSTFEEIKKMKFNLSSEFILYCQEKEISKFRMKGVDDGNDEEKEKLVLNQNYKKLKNLIANATKLYVEFWGIFAANITNNLNTQKLYKLGEKLNTYLKEINHLWDKNLKNKKIDADNENNAQLLSRFLSEILWDQNRSDAVQKKINEEHNMQSYNRIGEEDKNQLENIDNLETQDYVLYTNTNEKGKTSILQYSNSLTYLIGYQKFELINKSFGTLLPPIMAEVNSRLIEDYIKSFTNQNNSEKDSLHSLDRQKTFILMKSKMGYIIPFNARYTFYDNNDFSNNFLIKAKYESRDVKSMYAYYLLTKPDFTLENISSSAIHLGLSLDLLKKYVIRLNVLIRTNNDDTLNLYEKYKEYKDEPKKIIWIDPSFIYPKDDMMKVKDIPIQDLIKKSIKIHLLLQIIELTDHNNEIIGFAFKIFENKKVKNKKSNELEQLIPKTKNQILFDLLTLNYIRTLTVKEKSGFRNLRENDNDLENENNLILSKTSNNRKKKTQDSNIFDGYSEDEKEQIVITKDKIFELQSKDSNGIKSFINLLPFYGSDISLIKHRPNKELYPTGKAQEPQIKIDMSKYVKLVETKLKENPKLFKMIKNMQKEQKTNNEESIPIKQNFLSDEIKQNETKNINVEDINRDFSGNANVSLINVINISSIRLVKIVDFFIYFFVIGLTTVHFILIYDFFQKSSKRYKYFNYSYQLLNDIVYIKYYVSEGIYLSITNYSFLKEINETTYLFRIKKRISGLADDLAGILYEFNNPIIKLPENYTKYISNANLTIKTNNEMSKTEQQPYSSAVNKLKAAIFFVCNSDGNEFNLENNFAYELMTNLMDSYYLLFERIIIIMIDFLKERSRDIITTNLIVFIISFAISIIYLILFYKMMVKLEKDREKPLNLFLTIKNKIFEDLKNSSENFSNKLLNKLFRADENEEESQHNFSKINIKPNDINIAKFKALNEYKSLNKKENSFISYFIQLAIFYGIVNIIILLEYIGSVPLYDYIHNYIDIYNSTYISEIYLVTRVNIIKQYFYNSSMTNYGFQEDATIYNFLYAFLFISQEMVPTIKETSKTHSFLDGEYKNFFRKYYFTNYTDLINEQVIGVNTTDLYANLSAYFKYGYTSVNYRMFEILKYLSIKYFMNPQRNLDNNNISQLINHPMWLELHKLLMGIVRQWYQKMDDLLTFYYNDFMDSRLSFYIILFIVLIVIISLYYWIAWKKYEGEFIDSIQKSFDLINLIPEEIKNIIINKLNEN